MTQQVVIHWYTYVTRNPIDTIPVIKNLIERANELLRRDHVGRIYRSSQSTRHSERLLILYRRYTIRTIYNESRLEFSEFVIEMPSVTSLEVEDLEEGPEKMLELPVPQASSISFDPEDLEKESFFLSRNMVFSREWFVWIIGEKNLFAQFLAFVKGDRCNMDRILFYETFEFLEDILSEELPQYADLRQQSKSFALQVFLSDDRSLTSHRSALESLCVPSHLLHHTARIYNFYFGVDSPMNFKVDHETFREIQTQYFTGTPSVTWLDAAIQQILRDVYYEVFPGFVKEVRAIVDLFNLTHRVTTPDSLSHSASFTSQHMINNGQDASAEKRTLDRVQNEKQLDRIYSHLSLRMTSMPHVTSSSAKKEDNTSIYDTESSMSTDSSSGLFSYLHEARSPSFESLSKAWTRNSPRYKHSSRPPSGSVRREKSALDLLFSFYDPEDDAFSKRPPLSNCTSQLFKRRSQRPHVQLSSVTTKLYLDTAGLTLFS